MKSADSWPRMTMQVWMKMLPRTGTVIRLAGGLRGCSSSLGPPLPITMASTDTTKMSQTRNCRSAMLVFIWTHINRSHVSMRVLQAIQRKNLNIKNIYIYIFISQNLYLFIYYRTFLDFHTIWSKVDLTEIWVSGSKEKRPHWKWGWESSTATHRVEGEDGAQLNEAVEGHVSEETEGGDQGTSALSAQMRGENVLLFLVLHKLFRNSPGSVGFHSFLTSNL